MQNIKQLYIKLYFLTAILFTIACDAPKEQSDVQKGKELIQYSQNLSIEEFADYYKVKVIQAASPDSIQFNYIFYRNEKPEIEADAFISIPIEKVVCLSTNHLPAFTALNKSETVVGFPGIQYIYEEALLASANNGGLRDVGQKSGVNIEVLMSLQPDLVMGYTMGSSFEQLKPIQKSGIPVILNADYLENSPLGRAEWLKLTAVILDKYNEGDSLFTSIEENYLATKKIAEKANQKPSVMTGVMYGDVWYVPGGESFAAKFIEDAGGKYLWSDNPKTGSIELSFESVLEKAKKADFWIGAASFTKLEELKNSNTNYSLFDSFENGEIYSYTKRVNKNGANDFLESGYMRPDLILKDYLKILHPSLLPEGESTYFQPLKP
ncbi:ABC transporter substrate-binding protein [Marivirga tractuosa]|uniref:Periplasmic binding protein n=1 Tax=Marivirga tractuosa (strain ATCC 23168 / DSM 4126 / NBRC 15989 / NCIMB 1408 / VKM B-1430 / H-43) TaxID=643867 RepID=E4TST3_MARTH|nr:ABC transporter substrate-binding protein [Marivirga tractuosa]ADR21893.1 periplasmic binding protein [Marivirga tractuosa DSM 4126]BDD13649.1 ABC transporter substrate-binding protein [Marivirga tractuosa]